MSLVAFRANNHPQQVDLRAARDQVDDRGTPADLFEHLNRRHHFTLDVAAAPHNAKCARYFTRDDDGLLQSWAGESVWCNPPYSDLRSWLSKAWQEYEGTRGIVMLLPANRTEQVWWQRHVEPRRDREGSPLRSEFLAGRTVFSVPGQSRTGSRPPFGCVLLTWSPP